MSDTKYSAPHMMLHWVIAVLVVAQLVLPEGMGTAFDQMLENITPGGIWTSGAVLHAVMGTTIGLLMVWRLMLRLTTQIPPPPAASSAILTLSRATHWLFYALLIGMPIAGALAWFIPSALIGTLHGLSGKVLIGLIVLHIAGALYHHLIAGDKAVLRRMLPR